MRRLLLLKPLTVLLGEDIAHRLDLIDDRISVATWSETEQLVDTLLDTDGAVARLATLLATASYRAQHHGADERATRYAQLANDLHDLLLDYEAEIPQTTPAVPSPALAAAATAAAARRGR